MADDKLRATPAARKLADDLGINLYDVSGSGANGRVHKEDVETYKDTNVVRISPLAKRIALEHNIACLLYTSPSPRDRSLSRMPSSA